MNNIVENGALCLRKIFHIEDRRYDPVFEALFDDIVVARAVAPLKDLVRWAHPFLKRNAMGMSTERRDEPGATKKRINGSALVAFKGGDLESEIGQLRNESGVGSISTVELILKGSAQLDDSDKKIVVVEYMPSNK